MQKDDAPQSLTRHLTRPLRALHEDEGGVAMTEYLIVFSGVSLGSTVAILSVAVYVKGYRDFLIWWLTHPLV